MTPSAWSAVFLLGLLGSLAAGVLLWRCLRQWGGLVRLLAAALPPAGFALSFQAVQDMLNSLFFNWSAARLCPSFALVNGYRLYYGPTEGPALNTLYGPVSALVYLPATLGATPNSALLLGSAISLLLYLTPVAWILAWDRRREPRALAVGLAALACFALLTHRSYPLAYGAFTVHADAPALGFSALACGLLCRGRGRNGWRELAGSAVAAVLAIGAKQTMAPLLLSLPLYLWWSEGSRSALRYLLCAAAAGLAALGAAWVLFDGPAMLFNIVTIPGRPPLRGGILRWTATTLRELVEESPFPFAVLGAIALLRATGKDRDRAAAGISWWAKRPWMVFVLAACLNLPMSVLNRAKIGADLNALAPAAYPLLIAACAALRDEARRDAVAKGSPAPRALGALAVLLIGLTLAALSQWRDAASLLGRFRDNVQTYAYQVVRERPGEVYFPNQPLAHLMGEGRLYHFSVGLGDRRLAGYPVSPEHFRRHIPERLKAIMFGPLWSAEETETHREILRYLPDFQLVEQDGSGWSLYLSPAPVLPPSP